MRTPPLTWTLLAAIGLGLFAPAGAQETPAPAQPAAPADGLHAENVEVRRSAANALRISDKAAQRNALPRLIELLNSEKDGQVRLAVFDVVTALGPDAEPAIPALVHTLRSNYGGQFREELHQDYRSALALAAIGRPAVEALRGLLTGSKENVRAEVVMALGRIGPDADQSVADLVPLLADRSERIRAETVRTLGKLGPNAVGPLVAAATGPEALPRSQAVESLGAFVASSDAAEQAVLNAVHNESPTVRAAAMRALTRSKIAAGVATPILVDCLRDQDEPVRLAAVNVLIARPEWRGLLTAELESLLTAENDGAARHAAYLLSRAGSSAAPRLLNALRNPSSRIESIAEALAQIGDRPDALLTRALDDPDPRVRRGAALALGQVRPIAPATVAKLAAGLSDPDREVRTAFLTAIHDVGPRVKEIVPTVRGLLDDPSAAIRLRAIAIIARSAPRDEQLIRDLTARLEDADGEVQRQAIVTLRALGPLSRPAIPAVVRRLESPAADVRIAAMEMLGAHGRDAAEAVPGLRASLDDPAPAIRTTGARTLGQIGKAAQPARNQLTALTTDPDDKVRTIAVFALGALELAAEDIRPPLAQALRDPQATVRQAALRVIQRQGPQAALFLPDVILLAANKETAKSAERLLRQIERTGAAARSIPELVQQLGHDQDAVRLLAIKFLARAGRDAKDAVPALERLRDDPSAEIRKQAEQACEQIKQQSAG